jgi:hypothetical protein
MHRVGASLVDDIVWCCVYTLLETEWLCHQLERQEATENIEHLVISKQPPDYYVTN